MPFFGKLKALVLRGRAEREIARDVESQLGMLKDELARQGVPPEEASFAARRAFGGVEQAKEAARDEMAFVWLEQIVKDVRHALRGIFRSPGFAAVALVSLALGMGANTAVFTLVNGILLKRLPVPDPERIVQIEAQLPQFKSAGFSYPAFRELRRQTAIFSGAIGFAGRPAVADIDGDAQRIRFEFVTGSFFPFFGARPALGRLLDEEDDRVERAQQVCVVSYAFWQTRFGGEPHAVGRTLRIQGVPLLVVGVVQPGFSGPELQQSFDIWAPTAAGAAFGTERESPNLIWLRALARLRPGVPFMEASARLRAASGGIEDSLPQGRANAGAVYAMRPAGKGFDTWRSRLADPLEVLMGAVTVMLLVACANLANILLARTGARRREFDIKLALGITRRRLFREQIIEALAIAFLGGALGLAVSSWLTRFLLYLYNSGNPYATLEVAPDATVLAYTFGVCVLTAVAAGVYPALRASRGGLNRAPASRFGAVRRGLILAEVTGAVVLLFGASLFAHSLGKLKTVNLGYDIDRVLAVSVTARGARTAVKAVAGAPALEETLARVRQLPQVEAAAFSEGGTLSGSGMSTDLRASGRQAENVHIMFAGPRYFATMRMPLLRGREFLPSDRAGSQSVAIVNERLASMLWPGQDPVGKHVGGWGAKDLEIVGVVGDSKYFDLREEPKPIAYQCFEQTPVTDATLRLRFHSGASQLEREVRRIVKSAAPAYEVANVSTMEAARDGLIAQDRLLAFLSGLFAALCVALALTGIYGLISYSVAQRTREIGIRVSLGAQQRDVLAAFLRESVLLTAVGVALGVPLALRLARFVKAMLFDVSTADPAGIAATVALILIGSAAASALPARRAAQINPVEALRYE